MKLASLLATVTILLVSLPSAQAVSAEDSYSCNYEIDVTIKADNSVAFHKLLTLENNSDKNILNSFDLYFPYTVTKFNAYVETTLLTALKDPSHIYINLGDNFLKPGQKINITLEYTAQISVAAGKDFKVFYLPQNQYCQSASNKTVVNYPANWGIPNYISSSDIANESGRLTIVNQQDVYLVWGVQSTQPVNLLWQVSSPSRIVLPSSIFATLEVGELPQGTSVYKDDLQNQFLELTEPNAFNANFKGHISSLDQPKELLVKLKPEYRVDLELLSLDQSIDLKAAYNILIDKFNPKLTSNSLASLGSIADIKTEQDSLTYANYWAAILQTKGYQSYILFGPTQLALSEDTVWNYWVGVYVDGKWMQFDPFLEDLIKFSQFGQVTPQRQSWGILTKDNLQIVTLLDNVKNTSTIFEATGKTGVLGESFAVDAILKVRNELTRDLQLSITNNGNKIVYLQDINLGDNVNLVTTGSLSGLLPKQTKIIDLKGVPGLIELLKNQGNLQAKLNFLSNDHSYSISSNQVAFRQLWLYGLVFGGMFIISIALGFILKILTLGHIKKLISNLRSYKQQSNLALKPIKPKRNTNDLSISEPRDFPDLYQGLVDD